MPDRQDVVPEHMPSVVGLCPDPSHTGEFYVPHGGNCPADHFDHRSVPMVEFVPLSRAERAEAEVERLTAAALKVLRHFVDRHHGGGFKPLGDGESVDRDVAALQRALSPDREDGDG